MKERTELHCHNCNKYVQFDLDMDLNGLRVITCPVCGHEHYRIVKDGVITDERWGSSNITSTIQVTNTSWSNNSTYSTYRSAYNSGGGTSVTAYNAPDKQFFLSSWSNAYFS